MAVKTRREGRIIRHKRIRKKIFGTSERPRLAFYRSLNALYAQLINDETGETILSSSTIDKGYVEKFGKRSGKSIQDAVNLGKHLAEKAKERGVVNIVFDRGGFLYHGKVKAFADSLRENGLNF
ncbi:MAG: 50S ribosomal protein L18 [Hydrogenothermaceae bacterium]|nr:50S ribosomal protein L18 [Hydrogenothermaceae bacterium]